MVNFLNCYLDRDGRYFLSLIFYFNQIIFKDDDSIISVDDLSPLDNYSDSSLPSVCFFLYYFVD